MKYLNDYTEQAVTDLMNKYGAFYAFSNEQFNAAKKQDVKYARLGMGLICPSDNGLALMQGMIDIHENGIAQDIAENGKEAIIRRELYNHESFYTYDIEPTVEALTGYGITEQEVQAVFYKEQQNIS